MAQSVVLDLEDVSKKFPRSPIPAVQNVTISLDQGDILGLLGPSGCGKTTLLRIIAGFEKPETGSISINGRVVAGYGRWQAPERRGVGMVFQDYALFPHLTVAENVAFGLHNSSKKSRAEIKKIVSEVLALVGLSGLENRYPHQLSGGQQQRVALARALAPRPAMVLLDEPLSNLDVQVRMRLRQELRDILKAGGTSGIFVTHDREEAMAICDRVAVMRNGCVEQFGTPEEIYIEPASRFVAEFVTQANFVFARRRGKVWETEIGSFDLSQFSNSHKAPPFQRGAGGDFPNKETNYLEDSDSGELMIRQENLVLKPDTNGEVILRDRQFLGREFRYCLQTPSGQELIARAAFSNFSQALPVGTKVKISLAEPTLRLFPASNKHFTPLEPALLNH